eukprot:CAMPEP_0114623466 /NCGR_PEP_ID=MMETSP0168-20121206/10267_1 /TAXON_ID=95228 ORGANISM="Vannella sp., Strain DIVA3 517/6/12" /NCGR_SAMPLE_ID=MMETSP0168 /ASSEMBLY_ACC=CAM_ASM_000044 /LENGTH=171 /DNA_ID=CAMNT_0001834713 /DNA_START=53 /DNA_END=568 /DNA_ORIENTATION=+
MASKAPCRQNFSEAAEKALNDQINAELTASYIYRSMAAYFGRCDVALQHFKAKFLKDAEEESGHAQMMIDYMSKRGGRVVLTAIAAPKQDWSTAVEALEDALALEKDVNAKLHALHDVAGATNDAQMCDWIEGEFLKEQVDAIYHLAKEITNLKRVGDGLGLYMFDKHLSE